MEAKASLYQQQATVVNRMFRGALSRADGQIETRSMRATS
jgi:hypothetical protein